MFLQLVDQNGFEGKYNFAYLPMDFKTSASLGYGFVDLVNTEEAEHFLEVFDSFTEWEGSSSKVGSASWSEPHQGLEANIERFRNGAIMHESVPEGFKPLLFRDGKAIAFPEPTKKIKAPRLRSVNASGVVGA